MGFFSGLGGILGGLAGVALAPATGGASLMYPLIGSSAGSAIGGAIDSNKANKTAEGYYNKNMDFAQRQFQFQQDYIKNSAQWRVEDAKKAGLHPMAALGMSTPSFSPVSAPSSPEYASSGNFDPMEFGQNLNYAATKGKTAQQQQQMTDLTLEGLQLDNDYKRAQIDLMKVDALASSIATNQAFGSPPSPKVNLTTPTGIPSDPKPEDLFTFGVDGNGKKSRIYPTDFMTSTWEDRPVGSSLAPLAEAEKLEQDAKLRGTVVLGHVWSPDAGEFVPVGSNAGRRALDYWKRAKSPSPRERIAAKYPREKMNSLDRGFFDWVDRIFR